MKTFADIQTMLLEQREEFLAKDTGIEREKLSSIAAYKDTPYAVMISGLRRVGKSTLLAQIAKTFYPDNEYFFVNFEDERFLRFASADFSKLHEILIELFGNHKIFFLDEIQNIAGWERFVRRMQESGYKFYITGSNASLLSRELGTRLTGRYMPIELAPFSFREFLRFKNIQPISDAILSTTVQKGKLRNAFAEYLQKGGIPDALKYPELTIHKTMYDDILYRDVVARYKITDVRVLQELSFYLVSNIGSLVSYNKVKELLKLGSVNTVKSHVEYLQTSWLLFVINRYAFSVKQQQIANKKIYGIDTGLIKSIAFSFSENRGKFLENLTFLHLWRMGDEVYYYKTKKDMEVDFYLPKKKLFLQVCQSLADPLTRERELRALCGAMEEVQGSTAFIITEDENDIIMVDNKTITILPMYAWLLTE